MTLSKRVYIKMSRKKQLEAEYLRNQEIKRCLQEADEGWEERKQKN